MANGFLSKNYVFYDESPQIINLNINENVRLKNKGISDGDEVYNEEYIQSLSMI